MFISGWLLFFFLCRCLSLPQRIETVENVSDVHLSCRWEVCTDFEKCVGLLEDRVHPSNFQLHSAAQVYLEQHSTAHTHTPVWLRVHSGTCVRACVCTLCVWILILTWKGTSAPIYYALKINVMTSNNGYFSWSAITPPPHPPPFLFQSDLWV